MASALDQLKSLTTVVADTGDFEGKLSGRVIEMIWRLMEVPTEKAEKDSWIDPFVSLPPRAHLTSEALPRSRHHKHLGLIDLCIYRFWTQLDVYVSMFIQGYPHHKCGLLKWVPFQMKSIGLRLSSIQNKFGYQLDRIHMAHDIRLIWKNPLSLRLHSLCITQEGEEDFC